LTHMIEEIFTKLTLALSGNFSLALVAALSWGVLSILLSPCHLSSIPLIIGYISSQGQIKLRRSFYLALVFAVGILMTIAFIGLITASMGRLMGDVGQWGNYLVAGIFILIGLYLMDIIRLDWKGLHIGNNIRNGLWGGFVLGLLLGIGLGPCTFAFLAPVLGIVFKTSSDNWLQAILLILAFGIGHCAVIVAAGSLTNLVQKYLNWTDDSKAIIYIKRIAGVFVIFAGFYFIYLTY